MPTRAGWGVLVGGVLLVAAGRLVGGVEFLVPGAAAIAAVVGAVLVRRFRPSRIAIAKQLTPPRVPAGDPARVDLEVANRGRARSPLLRLHDQVTGTRGVHLSIAALEPNGSTRGAYRIPTTRRGILQLGPTTIEDVDPLGLARRSHRLDSTVRLIVHPPIEAIPVRRVPSGDDPLLGEELRRSLGLSDEEFDGLRPYAPGDDLRRIHWPSSARQGDLQVRQFRPPRHGRLTVAIDTRPPGDTSEALDITTSITASIAASVLDAGDATRIETTDGRSTPLVHGNAQLDPLLEFLALLEGGSPVIHPAVPTEAGTVVVVTTDPQIAADRTARGTLAQRLRARIVITCDARQWGAAGGHHSTGEWIHLTGPGQLADLWTLDSHRGAVVV
ncbi:MAG: DUF58 domain-containing protein [Acidimicrobiales bacterium]|nr:DUF58 domain-containing protein [Acidimicrobiales bacterium]